MTATTNRDSHRRVIQSTESDREEHRPSSISVVIPTYNERENIARVIQRCRDALEQRDFEIIVVDDDSPDKTWLVARQLFEDNEDVRVVRRRGGADLSTAVSRGFRESTKDACVVIDADLQHPPEKVPELLAALQDGADIAFGSRYHPDGGIENWTSYRKLVSKGATSVVRIVVPGTRALSDPVSGFFAVRREIVENVTLEPKGYKILLEVIVRCDWDEVAEIPYLFAERKEGKSNLSVTEYVRFLEHIIVLGIVDRDWDGRVEPDRMVRIIEFGTVGAIGAGVNTVVFLGAHSVLRWQYLVSGALAFWFAVNWNFLGNWLLTFDKPDGSLVRQYIAFHGVALGGFIIYISSLAFTIDVLELPDLLANTVAIGIGAAFNFLGAENIAFIQSTPSTTNLDRRDLCTTQDSNSVLLRTPPLMSKSIDHSNRDVANYVISEMRRKSSDIRSLVKKCLGGNNE